MKRGLLAIGGMVLLFAASLFALIQLEELKSEWWALVFPVTTILAFVLGRKSHKYCTSVDLEDLRDSVQSTQIAAARATDGKLYDIERAIKADSDRCFQRYIGTAKLHDELDKRLCQLRAEVEIQRARAEQETKKPATRTRRPRRGEKN